jgi:hypothetical protein
VPVHIHTAYANRNNETKTHKSGYQFIFGFGQMGFEGETRIEL